MGEDEVGDGPAKAGAGGPNAGDGETLPWGDKLPVDGRWTGILRLAGEAPRDEDDELWTKGGLNEGEGSGPADRGALAI